MSRVVPLLFYKIRFFFGPALRGRLGPLAYIPLEREAIVSSAFEESSYIRRSSAVRGAIWSRGRFRTRAT